MPVGSLNSCFPAASNVLGTAYTARWILSWLRVKVEYPVKTPAQPPALLALAGFVPMLACGLAAFWLHGPVRLPLLLLAEVLGLAAASHALGCRRVWRGAWPWRQLGIQLLLVTAYALWLWLLTVWPLAAMARLASLGASLLLSLALGLAVASLWAWWPWCGLAFAADAGAADRALGRRVRRAAQAVSHRPAAFMLPVALCQLLLSAGLLVVAGVTPVVVGSGLALTLWVVLLVPATSAVIAWRCRVADGLAARPVDGAAEPEPPPEPVGIQSLNLELDEVQPGQREQALLQAAREGQVERAMALLAADADPEARPDAGAPDRRSVMALATLLPDTRLLRALIGRGADVNGDGNGLAPLLIAVRDGRRNQANAVMTLLSNGADVAATDPEGNAALHFAALGDNADVAAMLLDAGGDIDAANHAGYTALALACQAGRAAMACYLLEHHAASAPARSMPALAAAADGNEDDAELVALLLDHGAAVDAVDGLERSALMHAALAGHTHMVAALLQADADINAVDRRGTTALMEAARAGANATLAVMAAYQPAAAVRDSHGRDALTLACQSLRADAETVRILLQLGVDPHAPGTDGRSALDHAATGGRWNLVALLDPDTPLPAAHQDDVRPETGADTPEHLLDALRFGHWAAVSGFRDLAAGWPSQTRINVYLQLLGPEHANARRWLFGHGLDPAARLADGRPLMAAVVEALPGSIEALDDLLKSGQGIAGRGRLAQAMQRLGSAAGGAALAPRLMQHDGDLFGPADDGMTPLHLAAAHGMGHHLKLLLAYGCNPNVRDAASQTPLHHALKQPPAQAWPLLRSLVAFGANPDAADGNGETPLGQALETGDPRCVYWLRWSPWPLPGRALRAGDLAAAAAAGDGRALERLLDLGFAADARDQQGATALLRACGRGQLEAAQTLLEAGADAGLATPAGATALTAAVTRKHAGLVGLLLQREVPLDQRLRGGATALLVASALGYADIAERLLAAGADVAAEDDNGRTALHAAAQFCFSSNDSLACRRLLDVLLEHGADIAASDHNGAGVLLFMLGGHARPGEVANATHLGALLPVLLDAGAPLDAADSRGVAPLHACAMHALAGPAKLLLARGAERAARDNHERTPAEVAGILGYVDVAHELS